MLKEATSLFQGLAGPAHKWQVALEAEAMQATTSQATTSRTALLSLPAPADGGHREHWMTSHAECLL